MLFTATGFFLTFCRWKPVLPHPSVTQTEGHCGNSTTCDVLPWDHWDTTPLQNKLKCRVTVSRWLDFSKSVYLSFVAEFLDSNVWLHKINQKETNQKTNGMLTLVLTVLCIFRAVIYITSSESKMIPICYLTWHAYDTILIHVCV